ncbi:hypothetical protein JHK82_056116 [Glycine max]|nr:hypothetical protein JHK82_056116 [Glycine max]
MKYGCTKTINLPISALVKSTYRRCNALFDKRGREVTTMLTSSKVYTQVLNKVIKDTQRKANAHICDCDKFQKLHMYCSHVVVACKHAYHEYRNYIHHVYMLKSVSNAYRGLFRELHNKAYWPLCHKPIVCPDPEKKGNSKGCRVSSRIHTKMDIRELSQPKRCFVCRISDHSKKNYLHCISSSE